MGRRSENTEYLKGTISDALLQLMENTPIDKITIQEITDLAGVGRMTYFRHFSSKTDVLSFKLQLLWKIWSGKHPCTYKIGCYEHALWFFPFGIPFAGCCRFFTGRSSMMLCSRCSFHTLPWWRAAPDGNSIRRCFLPMACLEL